MLSSVGFGATNAVGDSGDGPDPSTNYSPLRRGKRHDYFTSCLPWPQKGGVAVSLPLGTSAPIRGLGIQSGLANLQTGGNFNLTSQSVIEVGGSVTYPYASYMSDSVADRYMYVKGDAATGGKPQIYADLSQTAGVTINALRLAFQTQKMYERDARGGTRYREIVQSHFGVLDPNDSRLQRPEYLGGGTSPIMLTPVPQTSSTDGVSPQGNLAAKIGRAHV